MIYSNRNKQIQSKKMDGKITSLESQRRRSGKPLSKASEDDLESQPPHTPRGIGRGLSVVHYSDARASTGIEKNDERYGWTYKKITSAASFKRCLVRPGESFLEAKCCGDQKQDSQRTNSSNHRCWTTAEIARACANYRNKTNLSCLRVITR